MTNFLQTGKTKYLKSKTLTDFPKSKMKSILTKAVKEANKEQREVMEMADILKAFDEKLDKLDSIVAFCENTGLRIEDVEKYKQDLKQFLLKALSQQRDEIENMRELHNHNSIPNYTDNLDEGCPICIKNKTIDEIIKTLTK